jgi:predicted esterase
VLDCLGMNRQRKLRIRTAWTIAGTVAVGCLGWAAPYDEALYDVQVTHDIVYGVGTVDRGRGTTDLVLDLYKPIGSPEERQPIIVTIHGGGFTGGDKLHAPHVGHGHYFASRGIAVVSINYRLERDAPPADPQQIQAGVEYDPTRSAANHAAAYAGAVDTKTAIRWVHANAGAYGFDPDRVFAVGSSAGGFHAVVAGTSEPNEFAVDLPGQEIRPENHPGFDSDLQAIVNLWGGAGAWLDAFDVDDPPMMLVYGTEDWLYSEGERLRDRCEEMGMTYEWIPLKGEGHGAWSAQILGMKREEAILDFFRRHGLLDRSNR